MNTEPPPDPSAGPVPAAENREIRILAVVVGILALVGVGGGIAASHWMKGRDAHSAADQLLHGGVPAATPAPRPLPDFSLLDSRARTVTRAHLGDRVVIANLVFTSCSLSCLAVNDRMAELQRRFADASDVRLLSISVDPRTDTPEMLADFARRFHADPERWLFLTGAKPAIDRFLAAGFLADFTHLLDSPENGFVGTDRIYVVDRAGSIRASFNGLRADVTEAVARRVDELRTSTPASDPR